MGRCMACGGADARRRYPDRLRRAGTDLRQAGTNPGASANQSTILAPTLVKLESPTALGGHDECMRKPSLVS